VSVDTKYVHKAWHDTSDTIKKIKYPMLAGPARRVSTAYGTLIEDEELSLRGTFLIDPHGMVKAYEINDNSIGRSIDQLIRKLQAANLSPNMAVKSVP
jgi:peroxiredoxin (alkyl hydroperoxide reductase subunit C)